MGDLNPMSIVCLTIAAMALGVVIIVLVGKLFPRFFTPKKNSMSEEDEEEQRRSFAFGNANIGNEQVTRQTVDEAAKALQEKADENETYECSCTCCTQRVYKSGKLCGDCNDFGCRKASERLGW